MHKSKDGLEGEIKKYQENKEMEGKVVLLKDIIILKEHLEIKYSRSSGAGGQSVNKTNTKADIRFHIDSAKWINDDIKQRLKQEYSSHITDEGYFTLQS